ncbi:MAG: pre-peptidase C-terminal domain-containing protein, partial [Planctomyces sp.]|nr:pre-peptidase C-terminal domain-containing protein [Planctomyces sp.]
MKPSKITGHFIEGFQLWIRSYSELGLRGRHHVRGRRLRRRSVTPISESLEMRTLLFVLGSRWSGTSMTGAGLGQGDATTVSWTIVRDGTPIPAIGYPGSESADDSNLVAFLDGLYGTVTPDGNPQNAEWFPLFQSSFDRWSELGGITFVYTSYDDGVPFSAVGSAYPGVWGGRADVRIGGHRIDGPSGIIAYNFLPNNGEMVIDTDETYYDNTGSNSLRLRNTIMHEAGHGFGLEHIISSTNGFLMRPGATSSFDGPQFDDILGLQRHYGDRYEKGNGNNTSANAVTLGTLTAGSTLSVGTDAGLASVTVSQTDFVSIDDELDVDFYKFTVSAATTISVDLAPKGPTYTFGPQGGSESSFNATSQSDLSLQLIGTNGSTILASANSTGLGGNESIANFSLPAAGTYYVRVGGATTNKIQMYRLDVSNASASQNLTVALSPSSVSETAGSSASTGTVTRSGDLTSALVVTLTSGDTTEATVPATVTIPAGSASTTFTIAAIDDSLVDGTQSVVLTASATGYTSGTSTLSVTDNDVLTLTLSLNKSSFAENAGSNAATGTISRNSADLSSALVVTLTSSDTSELTVPATVTIPAGSASTTFAINAVDDTVVDGSQTATISATAT